MESTPPIKRKVGFESASGFDSIWGGGEPLPQSTRNFFEPRFGYDFGSVRVHKHSSAAHAAGEINAKAFTFGRNLVFGAGQYAPQTNEGKSLLAHELAHVVQQSPGTGPAIRRKIDKVNKSGCLLTLEMGIGIYGSRATPALAAKWQSWINNLWQGTTACPGKSRGSCFTTVDAKVTAHPKINWWWKVPESNSAYVREPGYRSQTNRANDSGDWAENEDDRSIAHETGHLMGQGDYYWRLPLMGNRSESGYEGDIMANYYKDPGPTEYGPALTRILKANKIDCPCC